MSRSKWSSLLAGGVVSLGVAAGASPVQAGLVFNFSSTGNTQADAGFAAAGARWSALFTDNITVNITAGFTALGAGILGSTSSTQGTVSYSAVRSAMIADATSSDDSSAYSHLQAAADVDLLLNRTSNNPNGSGSATAYLDADADANNTTIRMTTANAKALSLFPSNDPGSDASITFSSAFTWDFNPNDGITSGAFDFVGVATHEIGHALGFISGVDILDGNSPPVNGPFSDNLFTYVSPLDLFRFSTASRAFGDGVIDWTAGSSTKFFAVDGGLTPIANFATGVNFGDGRQASHWKDNLGLGIMDPTLGSGELAAITTNDRRGFDVIGYNLAVPEPASVSLIGLCVAGLIGRPRRGRR